VNRLDLVSVVVVLFGVILVLVDDSGADEPRSPRALRRGAVVFGSSSMKGTLGHVISSDLERNGYEVTRFGVVSAGLARPDFRDMRALAETLPIADGTALAFVYLGLNDGQALWLRPGDRQRPGERWLPWAHPRWSVVYQRRAQRLYETLCRRGARRVIVLLPVEVTKPPLEQKMKRIRALQRRAAERVPCATAVSTAGEDGFIADGKPTRLRDGFHLSDIGARLVWQRVKRRAALAL
jgi:hypothetical protein